MTPIELQIWNARECADYLRESYSQFIRRTQYIQGFPARCKMAGHPRWRAIEVANWALGNREAA